MKKMMLFGSAAIATMLTALPAQAQYYGHGPMMGHGYMHRNSGAERFFFHREFHGAFRPEFREHRFYGHPSMGFHGYGRRW